MVASAIVHLIAFAVLGRAMEHARVATPPQELPGALESPETAIRLLHPRALGEASEGAMAPRPRPRPAPVSVPSSPPSPITPSTTPTRGVTPTRRVAPPGPAGHAGGTGSSTRSAPERIRGGVDARLWTAPVMPISPERRGYEGSRALLRASLDRVRDSTLVVQRDSQRVVDWVWTDGQMRRWGATPECLYLGRSQRCHHTPPPDRARAWRTFHGLVVGDQMHLIRTERARAIRERADREREKRRPGRGGARP
jgi:hypothetical protein